MDRYEETLNALQAIIGRGAVSGDGRLPTERALSEELGVGRRVLRRALSALEKEGKVSRRQGSGTYVSAGDGPVGELSAGDLSAGDQEANGGDPDPNFGFRALTQIANPVELIELRLAIEPVMCRLAALRASGQDVARLRDLAEATASAGNFNEYRLADATFHGAVARLSRNALFEILQGALSNAFRDQALARFGESGNCFKRQAEHVAFHHAIVKAIAERDADQAERLMHEHLSDVHQSLFAEALPAGIGGRRDTAAE